MKKLYSIDVFEGNNKKIIVQTKKDKIDDILPEVVALNRAQLQTLAEFAIDDMIKAIMEYAKLAKKDYDEEREEPTPEVLN